MTINDIKTNGFTRQRLFRMLIGLKFGIEGFPWVFEYMLCRRVKIPFSRWRGDEMIQMDFGKEVVELVYFENSFLKSIRRETILFDGGTFIQETLMYDL